MSLSTQSLTYILDGRPILENVTLTFHSGIIYGILGPNGAGKSTFLKCLAGIWKPTYGTVMLDEKPLHQKQRTEISRLISLVPQTPYSAFDYTVKELIGMGQYATWKSQKKQESLTTTLDQVDLTALQDRPISTLSQGERQRVFIGRSLITGAEILLLDEPTAALDIRHQIEIWALLKELAAQGKTIIVTVHDLFAAKQYCNTIALIEKGKCIASGNCQDVLTSTTLHHTFGVSPEMVNLHRG